MNHGVDGIDERVGITDIAIVVGVHHQSGRVPAETVHMTFAQPHGEVVLDKIAHLLAAEVWSRISVGRDFKVGIALVKVNTAPYWAAA